ncbi:hypothetical protein AYL99_11415 [Fonsecaea erecta]|uniref:Uncharacterized protein n=1 Tax=Fonsecaea erecta TaxID=1367422 RepID=A0A178Z3K7_9EURO|nr:hypothetical protein AYL99_11415 [Fonsecaea erecta]OAP54314.1 hypothetical protein AYL99_11415 [Fonsecaea erecta]
MGRNNERKAARHARITQDFFDQVPESSTGNPAKPSVNPSSISLPTQIEKALDSFVTASAANPANRRVLSATFQAFDLKDDYRQVACLLGERIYHTFERNKDAARDLLTHLFTTAYLTINKSTGRRVWRIDKDVKFEIVEAIHSRKLIGLFTHERLLKNSNPPATEYVIDSPTCLDEFDVIGIIVDFFLDWSVECAEFLRRHPDLKDLDISLPEYRDQHAPFVSIGIIEIGAAIKTGKSIDLDPRPLEFFIAVRLNKMAEEQNLFIQGKPKMATRKNKGEGKAKTTEPAAAATAIVHTAKVGVDMQDDNKPASKLDLATESAKDEDNVTKDDAAAAEPTVPKMESTSETVKDKQVDKHATAPPVADAAAAAESTGTKIASATEVVKDTHVDNRATALSDLLADLATNTMVHSSDIPVTFDAGVANLTAEARNLSINALGNGDHPFGLRNYRPRAPAATAGDDNPLSLRSRLPAASVVHTDMETDADGPRPAHTPVPDEDPHAYRAERIRARLRLHNIIADTDGPPSAPIINDPRHRRHERLMRERLSALVTDTAAPTAPSPMPATDLADPSECTATPPSAPVSREGLQARLAEAPRARTNQAAAATANSSMPATDASGIAERTAGTAARGARGSRRARAGRRHASAAAAGTRNTAAQPQETATQRLARDRLYQELQDLVNTDFPNAAARRTAFAQARQRLLRSETVAAARGEQPLRATATRATQEALNIGRDDALNAARQQHAAEAARMRATGTGTEANARAREQGFGFDIGGMPGWYGQLEAMQIQALQPKKGGGKKEGEEAGGEDEKKEEKEKEKGGDAEEK